MVAQRDSKLTPAFALSQYKRQDVGVLASACQGVTVLLLYLAMYVYQFTSLQEVDEYGDTNWTYRIIGFDNVDSIAVTMIITVLVLMAVFTMLTIYQIVNSPTIEIIRLVHSGQPARLTLDKGKKYHLFLSHSECTDSQPRERGRTQRAP